MKGTFTARTSLALSAWDVEPEFEVEMVMKFTVQPGCAETRVDPSEPTSIEDISIRLFNATTKAELFCPIWLAEIFTEDDSFQSFLLDEARDQDECDRENAAEMRREDRS